MPKITFLGAGSTVFAKNVLGDVMRSKALRDSHIALYDIDAKRLDDSRVMLEKRLLRMVTFCENGPS